LLSCFEAVKSINYPFISISPSYHDNVGDNNIISYFCSNSAV